MNRDITIVFFDKIKNSLAYGIHKGRCVYQHRDHKGIIEKGELWLVSLEEFSLSNTYFATPIRKVTIDDILNLNRDNAKTVTDFLIRNHSEEVAKILEKSGRTTRTITEMKEFVDDSVRYVGNDTLESSRFIDGYYDICISPNNTTLMVIPRNTGRILCSNHRLVSEGLNQIIPSSNGEELTVESFEGFLVINLEGVAMT